MPTSPYFTPEFFAFLSDLKANNSREWFLANKDRYEDQVKHPALAFIAAFAAPLREISSHFQAIPRAQGGSLFRIYRDTRFSKDKTPYKTNVGIHFRHENAGNAHAPGFYVHLSPEEVFFGSGLWHPEGPAVKAIRQSIVERSSQWRAAVDNLGPLSLTGDSLKRPPRDFPAEHPLVEDLKRKDFIASIDLGVQDALQPDFLEKIAEYCVASAPLTKFLCEAIDQPF